MLKKKWYNSAFIILFLQWVHAETSLFIDGNTAYNSQNYQEAIRLYELAISEGYNSPNLQYNLGNAYYKDNQLAKSILHYERAIKLKPNFKDAIDNVKIAYRATVDKLEPIPSLFFIRWWNGFLTHLNASQWAWRAVFFTWLACLTFFIFKIYKRKEIKALTIIFGFFSITCVIMSFQRNRYDHSHQYAICMTSSTWLKTAPNNQSDDTFLLHEGSRVQILDKVDSWLKVRLVDGNEGWLLTQNIEKI